MSVVDGGGLRYNEDKLPVELVPVSLIQGVAEVLGAGAKKYAPRNWERGMSWSIPYACALRHLFAWWKGEELDKETQLSHLKHVAANIAFLIEYIETAPSLDDRPNKPFNNGRT